MTEDQARAIARDLFTNGAGTKADRLVLTIDGPPKRDLGGWAEHVRECLRDFFEFCGLVGDEHYWPVERPKVEANAHELVLEFRRFLTEAEWVEIAEATLRLPYVQGRRMEAVHRPPPKVGPIT